MYDSATCYYYGDVMSVERYMGQPGVHCSKYQCGNFYLHNHIYYTIQVLVSYVYDIRT